LIYILIRIITWVYKVSINIIVIYFWIPTQKWENTNIYIQEKIQKIIGARKGCWNAEKIPKFVEEIQKCKRLKFDSESLVDNEDSIEGRKVQNQMFMDSIKFYPRFNWIYEGFDCKKIDFLSQFRFLLEEIKVLGFNYNFEELIWSNQGLNCIIIEVWWPIKDLIETIQNQGLN
jgi:hypothetical protein